MSEYVYIYVKREKEKTRAYFCNKYCWSNIQKLLAVVYMDDDDEIIVTERCSFIRVPSRKRKLYKQHTLNKRKHAKDVQTHACINPPHQLMVEKYVHVAKDWRKETTKSRRKKVNQHRDVLLTTCLHQWIPSPWYTRRVSLNCCFWSSVYILPAERESVWNVWVNSFFKDDTVVQDYLLLSYRFNAASPNLIGAIECNIDPFNSVNVPGRSIAMIHWVTFCDGSLVNSVHSFKTAVWSVLKKRKNVLIIQK